VVNISTFQWPQHTYTLLIWRKITKGKSSISCKLMIQKYKLSKQVPGGGHNISKTCCTHSKFPHISITFTWQAFQLVYQFYQLPKSQHAKLENRSVTLPPKTLRFAAALTKLILQFLTQNCLLYLLWISPQRKRLRRNTNLYTSNDLYSCME
jgi:hypothetical protein